MTLYSSITTVHAPVWLVLFHSRFLRQAGVSSQYYFFDKPEFYTDEERDILSSNCNSTFCDSQYWKNQGGRGNAIGQRQATNIAYARKNFDSQWFLHIDIDEFPYFGRSIEDILTGLVPEVSEVRIQNVERVVLANSTSWCDGILRLLCADKVLLDQQYGPRAAFLGMGLTNYIHGKSLVKNGPKVAQEVHGAISRIPGREIVQHHAKLSEAMLVHYPMLSKSHLLERMQRKMHQQGRAFTHEYRVIEFLRAQKNQLEAINEVISELHFCSREEAAQWLDAGLCMEMPDKFRQLFRLCCSNEQQLTMRYMDQSFQEFFARKP